MPGHFDYAIARVVLAVKVTRQMSRGISPSIVPFFIALQAEMWAAAGLMSRRFQDLSNATRH